MSFDYRYKVRINCEANDVAPEHWPTITLDTFADVAVTAKPWIDAGYMVEIVAVAVGNDGDRPYDPGE